MAGRALNRPWSAMPSIVFVPGAAIWNGALWIPANAVVPDQVSLSGTSSNLIITLDDTFPQYICLVDKLQRVAGLVLATVVAQNDAGGIDISRGVRRLSITFAAPLANADRYDFIAVFNEQIVA